MLVCSGTEQLEHEQRLERRTLQKYKSVKEEEKRGEEENK
jgi:hypothetical protein